MCASYNDNCQAESKAKYEDQLSQMKWQRNVLLQYKAVSTAEWKPGSQEQPSLNLSLEHMHSPLCDYSWLNGRYSEPFHAVKFFD